MNTQILEKAKNIMDKANEIIEAMEFQKFLFHCQRSWRWSFNEPWLDVSILVPHKPRDVLFTMPIAKLGDKLYHEESAGN